MLFVDSYVPLIFTCPLNGHDRLSESPSDATHCFLGQWFFYHTSDTDHLIIVDNLLSLWHLTSCSLRRPGIVKRLVVKVSRRLSSRLTGSNTRSGMALTSSVARSGTRHLATTTTTTSATKVAATTIESTPEASAATG